MTWGTNPEEVVPITGRIPEPAEEDPIRRAKLQRSIDYMGLEAGGLISDVKIEKSSLDHALTDVLKISEQLQKLRKAKSSKGVHAMIVAGSGLVRNRTRRLGTIFEEAGFDWRQEPGCSMSCDECRQTEPGQRCASTSNRNFEGRQGL